MCGGLLISANLFRESDMKMIRIQLVNEPNLIREGLSCLLQLDQDMLILPAVQCGTGCGQACFQSGCDVIIIGTNIGASGSINCLRRIIAKYAEARVLLIICKEQVSLTNEAISIGAKGVVSMDAPSAILRRAVRAIAEGGQFVEPWLARAISETQYNHVNNPFDALTSRENDVLRMMLNGSSCALIASELHISHKTVANHHTRLMNKLNLNNMVALTRMAIRHKLIEAND